MNKFRTISAAVMVTSGLMLGMAGTASADTGSGESLLDLLSTGSGGSGSSVGITLGDGGDDDVETVADPPVSTGSAGMGSGSAPLCGTSPTTPGCPK